MLTFLAYFLFPKIVAQTRKCGGSYKKIFMTNVQMFGFTHSEYMDINFLMIVCIRLINLFQIFHRFFFSSLIITIMYSRIFIIIRILCVLYGLFQKQPKTYRVFFLLSFAFICWLDKQTELDFLLTLYQFDFYQIMLQ